MSIITIPRWFIRHQAIRTGMRLPVRPKFVSPVTDRKQWGFIPTVIPPNSGPISDVDIRRPIDAVTGDKFDPADFRFWGVYLNIYNVVQKCTCRNCGGVVISQHLRRHHSEVLECYDKLVKAYNLLELDSKCVICNVKTSSRKWGVPLCSKKCVNDWCFHTIRPESVSAALELVIGRG